MGLQINPDLGDSITIEDQGVRWVVSYWYRDTDFNNGEKGFFSAEFPAGFNQINPDGLESAMMELAQAVARNTGVHS